MILERVNLEEDNAILGTTTDTHASTALNAMTLPSPPPHSEVVPPPPPSLQA